MCVYMFIINAPARKVKGFEQNTALCGVSVVCFCAG